MTGEDPVEYEVSGINQTQVNSEIGFTFASALREILRQDPDVIMVGEIRDKETASVALRASMTGHLVLSTLHTNTTIGAINRLKDLGIDTYLISSSLNCVIAQRLLRKYCINCKDNSLKSLYSPSSLIQKKLEILIKLVMRRAPIKQKIIFL